MARTGRIYLAKNIKLDKNYKSVLNYTENQMINLITDSANLVYSALNYQFIRDRGTIQVNAPYSQVIQANYMAFQNPDYSNKYFFAFIDEVKYLSPNASEIVYTVDIWSTWWSYWSPKACFVLREHVTDDTIGSNTVPENLELGEYLCNEYSSDTQLTTLSFVIQVSEWISDVGNPLATSFGGIPMAGGAYIVNTTQELVNIIQAYQNGREDAILNVYVVPSKIINNTSGSAQYSGQNSPVSYTIQISKPTKLDNYTPINKKLLTYPFCYMILDNNNGSSNILQYERFTTTNCTFDVSGVPVCGGSIKCTPTSYKSVNNYQQEGIMAGKFPTLSWSNDPYTNWLTQNAVNLGLGVTSAGLTIAGGIGMMATGGGALAGAGAIISGGMSIAQIMGQKYQHSIMPRSAEGNINGGDINTCADKNTFFFYKMSISYEFASRIDQYLTRMGYAVNKVKVPNMSGRTNYNFVQVANDDNLAYPNNYNNICLPANALDTINTLFRNGITIWNNHANFGDYSVSNVIVS